MTRSMAVGRRTLALLLIVCAPPAQAADTYPSRPIRLVVGFGAGGPTDIPARFIADRLGTALGQPVVVENKPAAGGIVATRDVLAQPRDGYTLLLCTHFDATNVAVYRNAGYQLGDIAPISLIAKYYYGLALANVIPADDFKSFVTYAKAHPGEVTYATVGAGSSQEIMARQIGETYRRDAESHSVPRWHRRGAGTGRRQGRSLPVADLGHHVAISGQAPENSRHHQSRNA